MRKELTGPQNWPESAATVPVDLMRRLLELLSVKLYKWFMHLLSVYMAVCTGDIHGHVRSPGISANKCRQCLETGVKEIWMNAEIMW